MGVIEEVHGARKARRDYGHIPFYAPNLGLKIVTDEIFCYCGGFEKSRGWSALFLTEEPPCCSCARVKTLAPHHRACPTGKISFNMKERKVVEPFL